MQQASSSGKLMQVPDVILLKGAPGVGKSTTAKELAKLFPQGVRLEVDALRAMVITPDWKNQVEHIAMLRLSTKLVVEYLNAGMKPIIVIDTFSGDKLARYVEDLRDLNNNIHVQSFSLVVSEEELVRRVKERPDDGFKEIDVCLKLNRDVVRRKLEQETQLDITGASPKVVAERISEAILAKAM